MCHIVPYYLLYTLIQNWWTSTTFSTYYRKWNGIIHDWIHTYIYSDLKAVSQVLNTLMH